MACQTIRYQFISDSSCTISSHCLNGLKTKQHFINSNKSQNVFHMSFSRIIDHFAPCALSRLTLSACQFTFTHCYFHVHARQCNSCNQRFSHLFLDKPLGYAISSWSASTVFLASMLNSLRLINFEHPRSASLLNIQRSPIPSQFDQ